MCPRKTDLRTVHVTTDPSEFYPLAGLERLWKDVVELNVAPRERWKYEGVKTTGAGIFHVWVHEDDRGARRVFAIDKNTYRDMTLAPGWRFRQATKGTPWL